MASSNNVITAPVVHEKTTGDIQTVIGAVGTDDLETLCKWPYLNKWSKKKPIKYARVEALESTHWVMANYGIMDIPTWTRLSYMSTFLFSDARGSLSSNFWPECDREHGALSLEYWEYNKPTGGAASPYRQSDFDEYFHEAEAPIGPMPETNIVVTPVGTLRIRFAHGAISNYTLKLSELTWPDSYNFPIGNMYFGVLMKQTSGTITSRTYVATQKSGGTDIKMSETDQYGFWVDWSSTIVEAAFAGTWRIYPIISSIPIAETTSISTQDGNKFIAPLPYHNQAINITIQYAEISVESYHGFKDADSQQRYARFNYVIKNTEEAGAYRNFSLTVTLCDANGDQLIGYSGGTTTGQLPTGGIGSVSASCYIAQIWNTQMYYKTELTITDPVKFKRTTYVGLTGPILVEQPSPDI